MFSPNSPLRQASPPRPKQNLSPQSELMTKILRNKLTKKKEETPASKFNLKNLKSIKEIKKIIPEYLELTNEEKEMIKNKLEEIVLEEENKEAIEIIENYEKDNLNMIFVRYSEWENMINNLERFYKIKYSEKDRNTMINKFIQLILNSNENFYLDQDNNIIYSKSIDYFEDIVLNKEEIKNIIIHDYESMKVSYAGFNDPYLSVICPDFNFVYIQIVNVFVNTLHLYFFYREKSEDKISISNSSSLIEKKPLGILFYTHYLSNKYSKELCPIYKNNFDELLEQMIMKDNDLKNYFVLVDDIFKNKNEGEYRYILSRYKSKPEVSLYYCMINNFINCNFYYMFLMYSLSYELMKSNSITFNYKNPQFDRLNIGNDIVEKINSCISQKQNYPYFIIFLRITAPSSSHANLLFIDLNRNLVERYEPQGSRVLENMKELNAELFNFFTDLGLRYKYNLCDVDQDVQEMEKEIPKPLRGKCVSLSLGYLDYRLKYAAEGAPLIYNKYVNKKGIIHWYDLQIYNYNLFNEMNIYMDQINDTFGTCINFTGNRFTFHDYLSNRKCNCHQI
jgi:hypothetical protein